MENTKFIYAANSDLDDELFYAEFDTKDEAIDYAKQHLDKLPFVDELEVSYDANGEIADVFNYKTIWDHTMADQEAEVAVADAIDTEDAYWDFKGNQEVEAEKNKYDLGDTTWFESLDNLVEEMEENEDLVECKECFDLFPKTDCVKLAFGYICPCCNKSAEVTDSDTFKIEFPEYEKFRDAEDEFDDSKLAMSDEDVARVNEPFEEPFSSDNPVKVESEPEFTAEEAVPFLVNDEVEAVAGYEQAAEVVADSDLENKEEILDIIDHIKEEEEEHIEELQDLVDTEDDEIIEVENDPISGEAEDTEEELVEHINDRAKPIESDQELEGTDNAVVKCKVADVVTHSEDEKPVDCEGKKKPLEKPLAEKLDVTNGYPHIKSVATMVHKAVDNYTKDNKVATRTDGTSFYVLGDKTNSDPEKMKKIILDTLAHDGYDPEVVQYVEKGNLYGYVIDKIRMTSRMTLSYKNESQIKESLYNFTEEEMTEYNMDEDGISLDSYDEYVRCNWCGEVFTVDQCIFEANMGWLCDRCEAAIRSRGEKLTILTNPTDDEIISTLTEAKKMTRDEMIAKEGTDNVDLVNAGREEEDRVEIVD